MELFLMARLSRTSLAVVEGKKGILKLFLTALPHFAAGTRLQVLTNIR